MNKTQYLVSTSAYGTVAIAGIVAAAYFLFQQRWFLTTIGALIFYVAADNFFCSSRAKKCGYEAARHYTMPPFLRVRR